MFGTYCRLHLHVSASDLDVIRATRRKFKRVELTNREVRDTRHAIYRKMIDYHHEAQRLAHTWG